MNNDSKYQYDYELKKRKIKPRIEVESEEYFGKQTIKPNAGLNLDTASSPSLQGIYSLNDLNTSQDGARIQQQLKNDQNDIL